MAELQAMQALTLDPVQAALITAMNTAIADKNTAIAEKQAAIAEKQAAVDQAKAKKKAAKEKAKAAKAKAKAEVDQAKADKNAAIAEKQAAVDQAKAKKKAAKEKAKAEVEATRVDGIYHQIRILSFIGSNTNEELAKRLVSHAPPTWKAKLNFPMPNVNQHELALPAELINFSPNVKEEALFQPIAEFCQKICDLVGSPIDFRPTRQGLFGPDLVAHANFNGQKSNRCSSPPAPAAESQQRRSPRLSAAAAANVASPPSSVSIGTDPARRSAIGSLIMVQVKSSDSHHHEACLQLASYLLYYRLQFNDTQIPASVQSWPACLYGMAWLGCNVYVVRVDLKLDGKLIQPAITFCHTEPAVAVLFLLRTAIINDMSERSLVGDFDWRYNFKFPGPPPGGQPPTQRTGPTRQ